MTDALDRPARPSGDDDVARQARLDALRQRRERGGDGVAPTGAPPASTRPRSRRRHPAARSRVAVAAISVAGTLGLVGAMGAARDAGAATPAVVAAARPPTPPPSPLSPPADPTTASPPRVRLTAPPTTTPVARTNGSR